MGPHGLRRGERYGIRQRCTALGTRGRRVSAHQVPRGHVAMPCHATLLCFIAATGPSWGPACVGHFPPPPSMRHRADASREVLGGPYFCWLRITMCCLAMLRVDQRSGQGPLIRRETVVRPCAAGALAIRCFCSRGGPPRVRELPAHRQARRSQEDGLQCGHRPGLPPPPVEPARARW